MTVYKRWADIFTKTHESYNISCNHFGVGKYDGYSECKDCVIRYTCRELGSLFMSICNAYHSEDCDGDCGAECPVLNDACHIESTDAPPTPVIRADKHKTEIVKRKRRKMFQFGDKK